jgi:hypothetical protein
MYVLTTSYVLQYKIHKYPKIREYARMVKFLRDAGREKTNERLNAIKNGETLPNDILANVLRPFSKNNIFLNIVFFMLFVKLFFQFKRETLLTWK